MGLTHPLAKSLVALTAISIVVGSGLPMAAIADTAPQPVTSAATVSTDVLPTVQIDGVVWDQVIVGDTVFVGGNFSTARPAGSAPGVNTVPRTDLLAYTLSTGVLVPSFKHTLNGEVRAVAASPDGSRLYIGGTFTQIDGVTRNRIAAFDVASGGLITSFAPSSNSVVLAVAATNSTVYFGGSFTSVTTSAGTVSRPKSAAVTSASGAILPFAPQALAGSVRAIVVSPDQSKVVLGGNFTSLNGLDAPGYGMGAVTAATGASLPWNIGNTFRDAGPNASIYSLSSDGDSVYGSGYHFGSGGTSEGAFRADWANGDLVWIEDCHGDTYSVAAVGDAIYTATHAHYCGNSQGFPQTSPTWTIQRAMAWSKAPSGNVNTADIYGYPSVPGTPDPKILNFWPDMAIGTFTGANQAAWDVTGNSKYVLYGGEFPQVNGVAQQGLARFGVASIAPNKDGPRITGANFTPKAVSIATGTVRLSWLSNYDRDNQYLTYDVIRDGNFQSPVYTKVSGSRIWWDRPTLGFVDTGLTPGSTHSYRIRASDPFGNTVTGNAVSATVSAATPSPYSQSVLNDGATSFWRLGESTGPTIYDWAGFNDANAGSGVALSTPGALAGDLNTAATFSGDSTGLVATTSPIPGPNTFAIEAWFKTTTTTGGKIVGFGNANSGQSSSYDRHVYMDTSGAIVFGVYPGDPRTIQSSAGLNDNQWHHVVANLSASGMQLYIDGMMVAQRTDTTTGQDYSGYWRIGGDSAWSGANYFSGSIDDVAIYGLPLTKQQVNDHLVLSGRPSALPTPPADAYGAAVFNDAPDLYWRLGETSGPTAADAMGNGNAGIYVGGVARGVSGAIAGSSNTAAAFDGVDGQVSSTKAFVNPQQYSLEAWFETTSAQGGKVIGFGSNQIGTSNSYDRHIYLQGDGKVVYGIYNGNTTTVSSVGSYNDGGWHHVVATQSPTVGMKLYIDGLAIGTNPTTDAQNYTGYWKVGGDTTWGSAAYLAGKIDEVAVYSSVLSPSSVQNHFLIGSGSTPNIAPVSSFTTTTSGLGVAFDGSPSTDPDGTVASYSWNFGDGSTATGPTTTHQYVLAGSYVVSLTVTDNKGATNSSSQSVTISAPNVAPSARFTATNTGLTVVFDGSLSADPDGSITNYAWDYGDGTTGSVMTPSHTYTTGGSYNVSLTVTDNGGASGSVTHPIIVVAPNTAPTAVFTSASSDLVSTLDARASTDPDGFVASYDWDFGDGITGSGSLVTHTYSTAGTYSVVLRVTDNQSASSTITHAVTVLAADIAPIAKFTANTSNLSVGVDASGSSDPDGSIASYAWTFGDGGSATGATASHSFVAAGTYLISLTVTDNRGVSTSTSQSVIATNPAPQTALAVDDFARTSVGGLGTATTGGAWTTSGTPSGFSVDGSVGRFTTAVAGGTLSGYLAGVSSTDSEVQVTTSLLQASTGSGTYVSVIGRRIGAADYRARVVIGATGLVNLQLQQSGTTLKAVAVAGLNYATGDKLRVRLQVFGTSPTTVQAKVWKVGSTEPISWQVTATDSAAALQAAGQIGIASYLSGSSTALPLTVTFDDLWAGATSITP